MQPSMTATSAPSIGQRIVRGRWIGKIFIIVLAALAVLKLAQGYTESPTLFWQQVINGLQLGFVYALIALGYTMVYGIVRLINFAHGDVFMVGAFASYFAISRYSLHTWPLGVIPSLNPDVAILIGTISVLILSMAVCALLAIVIERIAYKPLRNAPRISALITAIGVSFFLEYFAALPFVFSPNFITYERPFPSVTWYINDGIHQLQPGGTVPPNSITFSNIFLIIVITSLFLLVALQFIVRRTKTGKAMRAVAYDKSAARLMGINADRIISTTFAIGAALAGAAGMLYAFAYTEVYFAMGILPGLKAFVAAVLGGIGSIPGAFVGALIMGQAEVMSAGYISTPMRDAIAFTILILVLLVRPMGIFGEPEREKA
jgi:branched-chain amino acid transport system permease protein